MPTPLITRLTNRLSGSPLLRNSIRGELVEEMVAQALEPEWTLCADDWGACDLKQVANLKPVGRPLRIQVKQSAARQSWHADARPRCCQCDGRWRAITLLCQVRFSTASFGAAREA